MIQETVLRFNLPQDAMELVYARSGRAYSLILRELVDMLSNGASNDKVLARVKHLCSVFDVVIFPVQPDNQD